jgi:AcrR family transcriptional regulator
MAGCVKRRKRVICPPEAKEAHRMDATLQKERVTKRTLGKARTREKIVTAARAQFDTHGYDRATIRGIAKQAGTSTGAIFANFTGKGQLFAILLEEEFLTFLQPTVPSTDRKTLDAGRRSVRKLIASFHRT